VVFKNKRFVSGVGVGLIAGALLLQMMIAAREADRKIAVPAGGQTESVQWDEQKVRTLAEQNKYALIRQSELDQLRGHLLKAEKAAKQAPSPVPAADKTVVYIVDGMSSTDIVNYLFEAGIINDKLTFEERITKDNLEGSIIKGRHIFRKGQTMEDVLAEITKKAK
jgi:rhodanese-related sulfurtransferase